MNMGARGFLETLFVPFDATNSDDDGEVDFWIDAFGAVCLGLMGIGVIWLGLALDIEVLSGGGW